MVAMATCNANLKNWVYKADKAAGPDDIKPLVLKELRNEITPFFLSFFRYCTTPSRGLRAGGLRLKATV